MPTLVGAVRTERAGSTQAHPVMHWVIPMFLQCIAGVLLTAKETEISAALWACVAQE